MASLETDGIVGIWKDSKLGGHVSSITSAAKGRANGTFHERPGTPSPTDKTGVGLAVDFGAEGGDAYSPVKAAIFNLFVLNSANLAELFYSHMPFYVKNGRRYPISALNRGTYALHLNHVHVAVNKGVIFKFSAPLTTSPVSGALPLNIPENDVPTPTSVMDAVATRSLGGAYRVQWDGGVLTSGDAAFYGSMGGKSNPFGFVSMAVTVSGEGYWLLAEDGGVFSFGDAPFLGSYFSLPAAQRLGWPRTFMSMQLVDYGNEWGYRLFATDGSFFDFSPSRTRGLV